jgi:hypothetical protein
MSFGTVKSRPIFRGRIETPASRARDHFAEQRAARELRKTQTTCQAAIAAGRLQTEFPCISPAYTKWAWKVVADNWWGKGPAAGLREIVYIVCTFFGLEKRRAQVQEIVAHAMKGMPWDGNQG